jgi:DNA-binding LacI/PurR family transcriptional regulator
MPDATIYDVAKKAGVSIGTVSNAINTPTRVGPETLKRVLAAIDELGFVPKTEAIAHARKGTRRIGVVAPFTSYPSFNQRLRGIIEALRDKPYELVIYDQESLAVRHDYLASLPVGRRLDGLIVMSLPFDEHVAARLLSRGLETILIEFARTSFSSVDIDNSAGGKLAAEYLIAKGHTRCAFVGEQQAPGTFTTQCQQRLAGFRQRLAESGLVLPDDYISLMPFSMEMARQQALQLLSLPEPPTAIFAHSDVQAIGVLKAARERGIAIPHDLAVLGFDDLEAAEYLGLSTVRQPLIESGHIAVRLLLERLADASCSVQHVMLPLSIIQRETA